MDRARVAVLVVLLGVLPCAVLGDEASSAEAARATAARFLDALVAGESARLRPLLPRYGKVSAKLGRFGPAQGSFSAGQIEALFADFGRHGAVRSFAVEHVDVASSRYAAVRGRVQTVDRDGVPAQCALHLGLEPEDGRWVVREIREDPP